MTLKTISVWTFLAAGSFTGFLTLAGEAQSPVREPSFEPNQVLVQFRAEATPADRGRARAAHARVPVA